MRASVSVPFLFVTLAGCTGEGCSSSPTETAEPSSTATSGSTAPVQADYEVHEWGLLRADRGDMLRVGAVAAPRPVEVLSVDKPVLYFHAGEALTLASVTVATPGGAVVETWPYTEGGRSAVWQGVSLSPSGECVPSPAATLTDAPCTLLPPGVLCESPGLAIVRTADAACVRVGTSTERFLFYRAEARSFTPPLLFERGEVPEDIRVTNEGEAPIPGVIVRISSIGGVTRTLVSPGPAPHETILIGHDFTTDADSDNPVPTDRRGADDETTLDQPPLVQGPGRDGIRSTMTGLGLASSEVDAFFAAWDATLFGGVSPTAVDSPAAIDVLSADGDDGTPAPRDTFLYFLPAATTDGVATLAFDPPPRAVHRALAIWTTVPATGSSH